MESEAIDVLAYNQGPQQNIQKWRSKCGREEHMAGCGLVLQPRVVIYDARATVSEE
jgi:hypothetical protein